MKYRVTPFGKAVKVRLIEIGESQEWLIKQCREATGRYIDSSYFNRILTGRCKPQIIISTICKILNIDEEVH